MLTNLQMIRNRRMLWSPDIVALNKRISDLSSQNQTLAFLKQQGLVDPDIFIAKTNELTKQLRQVKLEKEKLMDAESDMTALQTRNLTDILEGGPEFLDSFDAELFGELVEKIIIESNDSVRFCLKNGLELRESIERTVRGRETGSSPLATRWLWVRSSYRKQRRSLCRRSSTDILQENP